MRRIYILTVPLVLLSILLSSSHAHTITTPRKGLTISPIRSELEIAPGTALNGSLTVTNSTDNPMTVDLEAEEFSIINQQYDYAFTAESNVAKWVSFSPNKVVLEKDDTVKVSYTVAVPLLTEPGGRYVSMFASSNTSSGTGILSKQRLASLLYINVTGEVTRTGKLLSLASPWLISGDTNWSMTIQNKGSTHFRSRYSLKIRDIFGGEIGKNLNNESLILPNTVRLLTNKAPLPDWPGFYIADYDIGLGDTPARHEKRFLVYSPIWFTTLLTATVIVALIRLNHRKRSS